MKTPEFLKFKISKKTNAVSLRKAVEINPFFYWKHILYIFFIVLAVVAVVSVIVYRMTDSDYFVSEESKQEVQSLELTQLKDADITRFIKNFENRAFLRSQIIADTNVPSDPSTVIPTVNTVTNSPVQNTAR